MKSEIISIAGDASFRKFYRFILKKKSKIIVVANKEKYKNLIAYTSVNRFLRKNKILSPKLFSQNYSKGIIIIEDFGNTTIYKLLLKEKNRFKIYKKLVNTLIKIQKIKPKSKIKSLLKKPHKIKKYSKKILHEESDIFFDWYLPIFYNKKKVLKLKRKIKNILNKIYKKIYFPNSCFVHRDYHAQNLMYVGKNIGVIDSQDALIGNPAYDLVSLIDDVRLKTSIKLKNQVYKYYLEKNFKINRKDHDKFFDDFRILSVQRSLKIIGIFSRLFKRDKKDQYLKFLPYTWQLLEMRMNSEIFSDLKKALDIYVPKSIRKQIIYR